MLVAGIKTFVTHTAVDWPVVWGYPLTVLMVYGLMSGVRYVCRVQGGQMDQE
jgi:hypothetical protein